MRYQLICIRRPSKLSGSVLFGMAILLAWTVIAPSRGLAQADNKVTRVIDLEPVEGSSFINSDIFGRGEPPPQATVTLHSFGDEFQVNFKLVARPLLQQFFGGSYSLYFTMQSSPDEYIHGEFRSGRFKFNTDFTGTINVWVGFAFGIGVDDPQITAFIAFDPDDGRAFDPSRDSNRIVFVGTSFR